MVRYLVSIRKWGQWNPLDLVKLLSSWQIPETQPNSILDFHGKTDVFAGLKANRSAFRNESILRGPRDPRTSMSNRSSLTFTTTTRVIEVMKHTHDLDQPIFMASGLRRTHLQGRSPHRFCQKYDRVEISVQIVVTWTSNDWGEINTVAYEMNGERGQVYTRMNGSYKWCPSLRQWVCF